MSEAMVTVTYTEFESLKRELEQAREKLLIREFEHKAIVRFLVKVKKSEYTNAAHVFHWLRGAYIDMDQNLNSSFIETIRTTDILDDI